jgi:hypothetical protein
MTENLSAVERRSCGTFVCGYITDELRRTAKIVARAALRAAYVGGPLTPTGYAILAVIVAAVVLAAMLSNSSAGHEFDSALPLSWWFS